jgi:hypothetical protein
VRGPIKVNVLACAAIAAGWLCASQGAMAAQVLPAAVYSVSLTTFNANQSFSAPGDYALGNLSTSITAAPVTLIGHAAGTDLNVVNGNGGLESFVAYSFAVDGAPVEMVVPMFVSFTLHTSSSGPSATSNDNATARFVLSQAGNGFDVFNLFSSSSDPIAHPNFSGSLAFSQSSATIGKVSLQIDVSAIGGGVADAFIDPYIFIDPDFLASHAGLSVIVSDGIGNALPTPGGVPEPAAWALMVLGFGGIGAAARRRPRQVSAAG